VNANASPELELRDKQRQTKNALEAKITEQKNRVAALEVEIEQRRQLIEKKHTAMSDVLVDDIEALKLEIATHRIKMRQAEDDLLIVRGQLEVFLHIRST
jgi:chromosome segregation ATPase